MGFSAEAIGGALVAVVVAVVVSEPAVVDCDDAEQPAMASATHVTSDTTCVPAQRCSAAGGIGP
jgi:hypothetical protein